MYEEEIYRRRKGRSREDEWLWKIKVLCCLTAHICIAIIFFCSVEGLGQLVKSSAIVSERVEIVSHKKRFLIWFMVNCERNTRLGGLRTRVNRGENNQYLGYCL